MRSSKSRSRNKSNRNRPSTAGNVVNRVFDSSGPEGKVRGTPQQIIEKYNQLARDAQLSNDRVATENFQQHAEHYLRLLGEAQKEIDAKREQDTKREQQERENRERQSERDRERPQRSDGGDPGSSPQPEIMESGRDDISDHESSGDEASTLVDTPESKSVPKRAPRKPRQKPEGGDEVQQDAAPDEAKPRARRTRKPKPEAAPAEPQPNEHTGAPTNGDNDPAEKAAE